MLALRGHQRIAHVTVKRDLKDRIGDRFAGYRAACSDRKSTGPALVIECENSFTGGADAVAWVLESSDPIDARFL